MAYGGLSQNSGLRLSGKQALILALCLLLAACNATLPNDEGQEDEESEASYTPTSQQRGSGSTNSKLVRTATEGSMVSIPIKVAAHRPAGARLNLAPAAASAYTIDLEECDSDFSATATELSTNLQAYKSDTNCLAKLSAFSFNGYSFTPTAGDPFTSWQAGDQATFKAAEDPAVTLVVKVISTLDSPLAANDTIEYSFFDIDAGTSQQIFGVSVGASADLPGAHALPSFRVIASQLVGTTAGDGVQYVFTLECTSALLGDECEGVDLADLRYSLVADTYGGSPAYGDAVAALAGGVSVDVSTEKLNLGQGGAAHGGFTTKSGPAALASPDNVHSNPHMILFIEAGGLSYQYFNLDITVAINH